MYDKVKQMSSKLETIKLRNFLRIHDPRNGKPKKRN